MLGDEDGVIPPGSLPPIVPRVSGGEPFQNEVAAVLHHLGKTPSLQESPLAFEQPELPPEARLAKAGEEFIKVCWRMLHDQVNNKEVSHHPWEPWGEAELPRRHAPGRKALIPASGGTLANGVLKFQQIERLLKTGVHEGRIDGRNPGRARCRNEYHGTVSDAVIVHPLDQLEATHLRHHQIQNNHVISADGKQLNGRSPTRCRIDTIRFPMEDGRDHFTNGPIVVDDEHGLSHYLWNMQRGSPERHPLDVTRPILICLHQNIIY